MLKDDVGGSGAALLFGGTRQREPGSILGARPVVGIATPGQAGNVRRLKASAETSLAAVEDPNGVHGVLFVDGDGQLDLLRSSHGMSDGRSSSEFSASSIASIRDRM